MSSAADTSTDGTQARYTVTGPDAGFGHLIT